MESQCSHSVGASLRRDRLSLEAAEAVPYSPARAGHAEAENGRYMCAAAAFARDRAGGGRRLLLCSVHFYPKKALEPQRTTEDYLRQHWPACDAVVWGGDCNAVYQASTAPRGYNTLDLGLADHAARHGRRAARRSIGFFVAERRRAAPFPPSVLSKRRRPPCQRQATCHRTTSAMRSA